jgi:sec-independent protein translocase protein TatC
MATLFERLITRSVLEDNEPEHREMTFFDHLEELRWQIIKALTSYLIASGICIGFADFIVQDLLLKPLRAVGLKAQVLSPYGIVMMYMETVLIGALIISMPAILYFIWNFVAPGLLP